MFQSHPDGNREDLKRFKATSQQLWHEKNKEKKHTVQYKWNTSSPPTTGLNHSAHLFGYLWTLRFPPGLAHPPHVEQAERHQSCRPPYALGWSLPLLLTKYHRFVHWFKRKTKSTFNKQNTFPKMFPKKEGNTIVHSFHYISTKFGIRGIPIEYDTPGAWGPSPPN